MTPHYKSACHEFRYCADIRHCFAADTPSYLLLRQEERPDVSQYTPYIDAATIVHMP